MAFIVLSKDAAIWAQTLHRVHHSFTCTHFRTRVQFLKGSVTISYHPQLFPPAHELEALLLVKTRLNAFVMSTLNMTKSSSCIQCSSIQFRKLWTIFSAPALQATPNCSGWKKKLNIFSLRVAQMHFPARILPQQLV